MVLRERPDLADWWIEKEKKYVGKTRRFDAARFRKERPSYEQLLKQVREQPELNFGDEPLGCCRCTD